MSFIILHDFQAYAFEMKMYIDNEFELNRLIAMKPNLTFLAWEEAVLEVSPGLVSLTLSSRTTRHIDQHMAKSVTYIQLLRKSFHGPAVIHPFMVIDGVNFTSSQICPNQPSQPIAAFTTHSNLHDYLRPFSVYRPRFSRLNPSVNVPSVVSQVHTTFSLDWEIP